MKKKVIIILGVLIVLLSAVYVFIPGKINFAINVSVNCAESAAERLMTDSLGWNKWWPGRQKDHDVFTYKDMELQIDKIMINGFEASVLSHKDFVKGYLQVFSNTDSTSRFLWSGTAAFSNNPWERLMQYFQLRSAKTTIAELMNDLKNYFSNEENVYGFKAVEEKVKDSSLIAVKRFFTHYPSVSEIYELVTSIQTYINSKGGKEINYPMLNVYQEDSSTFLVMVAIPVERDLSSAGDYQLKKMILGSIIKAEIKGGAYTIKNGEEQLSNYVRDHNRVSPAIPYQSLVTNRLTETDTSKWITRLYYPVFKR